MEVYDVGSLPLAGDFRRFQEGAAARLRPSPTGREPAEYFERRVVEGFLDKVRAGVDIPNYPQLRDMNEMFLELMEGVERVKGGYMETGILSVPAGRAQIPEVAVLEDHAGEIREEAGGPFGVKVCVTGPYTLASLFVYRDGGTFRRLGEALSRIVEASIFDGRDGGVRLVALDEPTFGLRDDPMLDHGSPGREGLREAWESILRRAAARGVRTCMHLHSTVDGLFWDVESLDVVESHVDDPLYRSEATRRALESTDKFLRASVAVSDFDRLIRQRVAARLPKGTEAAVTERVVETWKKVTRGETDPAGFLEDVETMRARLDRAIDLFGAERIPYAGPECGLKSFPTYECAMECLRRVANAVKVTARGD